MTRWAPTGRGYHNPPHGGRREALPALQGRPHEGQGADCAASGARRHEASRAARSSPAKPRWGRRIGLAVLAARRPARRLDRRQLPLVPRTASRRRTRGCRRRSTASLAPQDGLLTSKPSLIMLLGTDGDRTRGAPGLPPLRLDPARPHRPRAAPDGVPLDPARPPRRHPRPRAEQDQRRLPARRPGADDEDRARAHRLQPNHVVLVDFDDFKDVIDALGGIEVDVPKPILSNRFDCPYATEARCQEWQGWRFEKGKQTMDGKRRADLLARPREPARSGRQRPHPRRAAAGGRRGDDRRARRPSGRS